MCLLAMFFIEFHFGYSLILFNIFGMGITFILLALGPGIMILKGIEGVSIKLFSTIIVLLWFLVVVVFAFTTNIYFAITENEVLRIQTKNIKLIKKTVRMSEFIEIKAIRL